MEVTLSAVLAMFLWRVFSRDPSFLVVWRKTKIALNVGPLPRSHLTSPMLLMGHAGCDVAVMWQWLVSPSVLFSAMLCAKGTADCEE